jgi:hypothetical protein
MIGNAVPVNFAKFLAESIKMQLAANQKSITMKEKQHLQAV